MTDINPVFLNDIILKNKVPVQISTNWSVSHLRHWRLPVASSGYYLYRYTGRSWFKSKQSPLRSILPNANIHHNEKCPGRWQGQTPGVHIGVCFSPWGGGQVNTHLSRWAPWNSTRQTGLRRRQHGSTVWECGWWLSVSLQENRVSNQELRKAKHSLWW